MEVGNEQFDVRARVAEGDERDRLWQQAKHEISAFGEYEQRIEREIPVIVLERVA